MTKCIVVSFCAILFGVGLIGGMNLLAADPTTAPATQPVADARPINTKCPVSGEDIDPKVTVVYDGITYGFCCYDCVKKFNKDPQKYISSIK